MTKYFTTIMAALAFVFTCQSCNSGNAQQNVDLDKIMLPIFLPEHSP